MISLIFSLMLFVQVFSTDVPAPYIDYEPAAPNVDNPSYRLIDCSNSRCD